MDKSFNPGDIFVNSVTLTSSSINMDLTSICMSFEIYESIFNPGIVGDFEILDIDDLLSELKPTGGEYLYVDFQVPGGESINYNLNLNSIQDVETMGSMKGKVYKLNCLSKETFSVRTNYVSKSYNTQISNMIQDIFSSYIDSTKNIDIEQTRGVQKYISPNIKPLELIHKLRKRAVSMENKSSNYTFFENQTGFNFKTIEGMLKGDIIKYYKQEDTVGHSLDSDIDHNIIAYKLSRQLSALDKISQGSMNQQVQTYDIRTKKYDVENKNPNSSDYGIFGQLTSDFFQGLFGNKPGKQFFIQKDSKLPDTHLSEGLVDKSAYLSSLLQNQLNIEVTGDTILTVGKCVYCHIPKKDGTTGLVNSDVLVSGKFLITKLAHIVKRSNYSPRYVNSLELIKADYEER